MNNLSNLGLNLKTLKISDLASLISDLNYNFSMVLKLPAFKGIQGDDGLDGVGISGLRGSSWTVIGSTLSASLLTVYGLTSTSQITLSFVNTQITTNLSSFLTNFGYSELVDGDILVLPDLSVLIYNESTSQFEDTGITFANGSSLTTQQVQDIVNNILATVSTDDDIETIYDAVGKLYSDASGGLNTSYNIDASLDLNVTGASAGFINSSYKMIAPKESKVTQSDTPIYIHGASQDYHDLIQNTLTNDTFNYGVGLDNSPIQVLLQNDNESGIFMGHRTATSMRLFSKIYKTSSNSLRLTSGNELTDSSMSYLELASSTATLQSIGDVNITTTSNTASINIGNVTGSSNEIYLNAESVYNKRLILDDVIYLGSVADTDEIVFRSGEIFITSNSATGTDAQFLSLNGSRLEDSGISLSTSESDNSATKVTTSDILYGHIQKSMYQKGVCPTDLNNAVEQGIYEIQEGAISYTNFPNLHLDGTSLTILDPTGFNTGRKGGILKVKKYDNSLTSSNNSYSTIVQELELFNPDTYASTTLDRASMSVKRWGSFHGGSWEFSEWSIVLDNTLVSLDGEGLELTYDSGANKYSLGVNTTVVELLGASLSSKIISGAASNQSDAFLRYTILGKQINFELYFVSLANASNTGTIVIDLNNLDIKDQVYSQALGIIGSSGDLSIGDFVRVVITGDDGVTNARVTLNLPSTFDHTTTDLVLHAQFQMELN